jgi:hypothetical protein
MTKKNVSNACRYSVGGKLKRKTMRTQQVKKRKTFSVTLQSNDTRKVTFLFKKKKNIMSDDDAMQNVHFKKNKTENISSMDLNLLITPARGKLSTIEPVKVRLISTAKVQELKETIKNITGKSNESNGIP